MKTDILILSACSVLVIAEYACGQTSVVRSFVSPSGRIELRLLNVPSPSGSDQPPVQSIVKVEKRVSLIPSSLLCESRIMAENHGFGWLDSERFEWIGDRFLVFDDGDGLCVIDGVRNQVLLNQTFTGYARAPDLSKWAAIRYRPTSRSQEQLHGDEKDTLWFIKPESLAAKSASSSEESPFEHIDSVTLDGIALARPSWTPDSKGLVVVTHTHPKIKATLFDSETREVIAIVPLVGLLLSSEQLLSPWFSSEVEELVGKFVAESELLSTAVTTNALLQKDNPPSSQLPTTKRRNSKESVPTLSEKPTSSIKWSIIIILMAAATGLLRLLLKRRS